MMKKYVYEITLNKKEKKIIESLFELKYVDVRIKYRKMGYDRVGFRLIGRYPIDVK